MCLGHEATDTGLAYAPVSQAHGHHHTQCVWGRRGVGGGRKREFKARVILRQSFVGWAAGWMGWQRSM